MACILTDLQSASVQLPKQAYADEAKPLQEVHRKSTRSRRNEPQQLGNLLVGVQPLIADNENPRRRSGGTTVVPRLGSVHSRPFSIDQRQVTLARQVLLRRLQQPRSLLNACGDFEADEFTEL